jgi:hypothetical protein
MYDLKVPTVQVPTELHCADGVVLRGIVYMPALSAVQAGPMLPHEWINSPPPFFPFRPAGEDGTLLVNKEQLLAISVAVPVPSDDPAWEAPSLVRPVVVEAGGKRFEGSIVIDMPENRRRVVDCLNRDETFLCLVADEQQVLVRKALISRVIEVQET